MNAYSIIFYFFELVAAIAAIAIVFSKNVFYAALLLITCLLCVAGLYVLSFAEFVAVTQIMVYAGGVLVLIIFGIMLTARLGDKPLRVEHTNLFAGIITGTLLLSVLAYYFFHAAISGPKEMTASLEGIGTGLMTTYLIPFEVAGILLLIALIGASIIASQKRAHKP